MQNGAHRALLSLPSQPGPAWPLSPHRRHQHGHLGRIVKGGLMTRLKSTQLTQDSLRDFLSAESARHMEPARRQSPSGSSSQANVYQTVRLLAKQARGRAGSVPRGWADPADAFETLSLVTRTRLQLLLRKAASLGAPRHCDLP